MGIGVAVAAAVSAISGATFAQVAFSVASSVVLGFLQQSLSPRPNGRSSTPNLASGFASRSQGITQNIRQPITSRRIVYGESRIGGAITFIETTNDNEFLHMVLTLADHEVDYIGEIWFDDTPIADDCIDGDGNVNKGDFNGKARIRKFLGTTSQPADPDLVAETSAGASFQGRGVAYLYVRLEYDRDVYPSSIPIITAWVRGKKLFDPRDSQTKYTPNMALAANDYLTIPADALTPGIGVAQSNVDNAALIAAANVCDEIQSTADIDDSITQADPATNIISLANINDRTLFQTGDQVQVAGSSLPGGLVVATNYYVIAYQRKDDVRIKLASTLANAFAGTAVSIATNGTGTITKKAEPRYHGGGVIESSGEPVDNLNDILSAMGGSAVYIGGTWRILAAAASTPAFTFDESHIIGPITVRPKLSRRDRFNFVKGVYVSPINDGQASDYPSVSNSTYATQDGGTIPIDFDLPMTQRPHTAQRLAKIKLEKARQEIFVEADFNLHAMQVQPGDVVRINNTRFGWSNKEFEVITWTLDTREQNGAPLYFVRMALQETASAVYDWNNGEETTVDPAPNTNLRSFRQVGPPTGISVQPLEVATAGGDITFEFVISWTPPSDIFVRNGGWYEVQFKESLQTEWRRSFRAEDEDTSITVKQIKPGINYDTRIRSVSDIGVRSQYNGLFGFNIFSPSGATIVLDDGFTNEAVTTFEDMGLTSDPVTITDDEGTV